MLQASRPCEKDDKKKEAQDKQEMGTISVFLVLPVLSVESI